MILEVATLDVKPGQRQAFQTAFREASGIIAGRQGHIAHQLQECLEKPDRFVLLVWWRTLEDHTVGFRTSPEYQRWRALLHHFYDPFPTVEHYRVVLADGAPPTP
ncbi:MAG: antibiotic biosynthesis monooxygenase [Reyranellaceae bacterium]